MDKTLLDNLFRPKSIAVIGASATDGKIGHTVMRNLVESQFAGRIFPINPAGGEILGYTVYPKITDVPEAVDAAVITIPAKLVAQAVEECGKKNVKGLIIITSGFSESGDRLTEDKIVQLARQYNMRVLGPNIVGTLSNSDKMNASFAPCLPFAGKAALITQSGALLIAIDAASYTRGVGFDKLISIGNMSDVDFADIIEWLDEDKDSTCISMYIEGLKDGRKFMEMARKSKKPIIALKSGTSSHGAAAVASHTGSLAGAVKVYGAAFQQGGVVQASNLDNLFDRTLALALQPPMKGDNLLVITNGGGVGVLATDAAERFDIPLKFAPAGLQAEMKKYMPDYGSAKNPVDMTGMAGADWYYQCVRHAIPHPWVSAMTVLYCETAMTNPVEIAHAIQQAVEDAGIKDKPVTLSMVGGERCAEAIRWLVNNGLPGYGDPEIAINAMAALRDFYISKGYASEKNPQMEHANRQEALQVIANARAHGRLSLTEIEAKAVFAAYGLPVNKTMLVTSEAEAVQTAKEIGFPVVMKIVSPDILHKSDAGGVKVNIKDENGVREAYRTILSNCQAYHADAKIHGIALQEMAPWGTEVILGSVNDPTFGPTMMFGLGGIFVEVLKDVTFRIAPVTANQAMRMLGEIRGAPILNGVRGESPRDTDVLAETIAKYSAMISDLADEVSESDANPVLVYETGKGLKIVDARMILKNQ